MRLRSGAGGFKHLGTIGAHDQPAKADGVAAQGRIAGNRGLARPIKRRQKGALSRHATLGLVVVQGGEQGAGAVIALADFNADCTLGDGRQHILNRNRAGDRVSQPQAVQPGNRQQCGINLASGKFAQPRVDIAAKHHHIEVGPQGADQRRPAQG